MAISQLTQEEIDEHRQQRERLAPIAHSVGLVYDEQNFLLLRALDFIASEQVRAGVSTAPQSARGAFLVPDPAVPGSSLAAAEAAVAQLGKAPQQARKVPLDMGDAVVDLLRAQHGLPPLRAIGGQ